MNVIFNGAGLITMDSLLFHKLLPQGEEVPELVFHISVSDS
jgi:hypothetical protein